MAIEYQTKRVDAQKLTATRIKHESVIHDGVHACKDDCGEPKSKFSGQAYNTQADVAQPVNTIQKPKGGRPSTGFDKKAYMSAFMRDKRKADKLGLKVSEYRKMKGKDDD